MALLLPILRRRMHLLPLDFYFLAIIELIKASKIHGFSKQGDHIRIKRLPVLSRPLARHEKVQKNTQGGI